MYRHPFFGFLHPLVFHPQLCGWRFSTLPDGRLPFPDRKRPALYEETGHMDLYECVFFSDKSNVLHNPSLSLIATNCNWSNWWLVLRTTLTVQKTQPPATSTSWDSNTSFLPSSHPHPLPLPLKHSTLPFIDLLPWEEYRGIINQAPQKRNLVIHGQ